MTLSEDIEQTFKNIHEDNKNRQAQKKAEDAAKETAKKQSENS